MKKPIEKTLCIRITEKQHKFLKRLVHLTNVPATEMFRQYLDYLKKHKIKTRKELLNDDSEKSFELTDAS